VVGCGFDEIYSADAMVYGTNATVHGTNAAALTVERVAENFFKVTEAGDNPVICARVARRVL
jgi:hypothetical protein